MSGLDEAWFRREAGRLHAALLRRLGPCRLPLVEDVVQETLASAFESWRLTGVPEHAQALLMTAAKNRAIDALRRERTARRNEEALVRAMEDAWESDATDDAAGRTGLLADDELRTMFTCCAPGLDERVQVALVLHVLSGFGARELAEAFFVSRAAMEKRLARGKKVLASVERLFELGASEESIAPRLGAVQRVIYLLFNEGYHGTHSDAVVRRDLCRDALRLVVMLVEDERTATPSTLALAALLFLNAARLPARLDEAGDLRTLFEQDRSLWDHVLAYDGARLLEASGTGDVITAYHLEAAIAAEHTLAERVEDTRWAWIVVLYDRLLDVRPSPMASLGRAMAIAERDGPLAGIDAISSGQGIARLERTPFLHAALGELRRRRGEPAEAKMHFEIARERARNDAERRFLDRRIADCDRD